MVLDQATSIVQGIWDDSDVFARYRVSLTFVDRVMGGVPQRPDVIEGWLKQRLGVDDDEELRHLMIETLDKLGVDAEAMTREQLTLATKQLADEQKANTFYRDEHGLYLRDYQVKAAFKEATNILFAGERWGKTKKGPKNFVAERIFVDEVRLSLGRMEPDGTHLQVGHVSGPQGPRSTLTYYEYCERPSIQFTVSSLNDEVTFDQWRKLLLVMQREGLGAIRSLGYGQFRVTGFERA